MEDLKVAGLQQAIIWGDIEQNLEALEVAWEKAPKADVYLLPETFATGFATDQADLKDLAQPPTGGAPAAHLAAWAIRKKAWVGGTVFVQEANHRYRNRFFLAGPDGALQYYDKRHRFGIAGEKDFFDGGDRRLIVEIKGWHLLLAVCYDLRFPVWLRQQMAAGVPEYDGMLIPANWPSPRQYAWDTLLRARAMENQCYVLGVNRVGMDGLGIAHEGGTVSIGPWGDQRAAANSAESGWIVDTWEAVHLAAVRKRYPFLGDADAFNLE